MLRSQLVVLRTRLHCSSSSYLNNSNNITSSSTAIFTSSFRFQSSSPSSSQDQQQQQQQQQSSSSASGILGGEVDASFSRHGGTAGAQARTSTTPGYVGVRRANVTTMPPWERLGRLCRREHAEELRRKHRPPFPKLPAGWQIYHEPGTAYFTMHKKISSADRGSAGLNDEELRVFCAGDVKEPERTFRQDDGERDEPEHLNYTLFITKPGIAVHSEKYLKMKEEQKLKKEQEQEQQDEKTESTTTSAASSSDNNNSSSADEKKSSNDSDEKEEQQEPTTFGYSENSNDSSSKMSPSDSLGAKGGLEIGLTTIDNELVLDTVVIHDTLDEVEVAWGALIEGPSKKLKRDDRYRGPYMGELDEDFIDEILNYLDDRGVNNAFAEFMQGQWHWYEQTEYEEWLRMFQVFSERKEK